MGALLGLMLGLGLLLVWQGLAGPAARRTRQPGRRRLRDRLAELIAEAGLEAVTPRQLLVSCAGAGGFVGLVFLVVSRTWPLAIAFGAFAAYSPVALVRFRGRQRRNEVRDLWPDAVDNLASAVRAGLSLPEALTQLGSRGPEPLRQPFLRFGEDYRATAGSGSMPWPTRRSGRWCWPGSWSPRPRRTVCGYRPISAPRRRVCGRCSGR